MRTTPAARGLATLLLAVALPVAAADVLTRDDAFVLPDPGTTVYGHSFTQLLDVDGRTFTSADTFHDRYGFEIGSGLFTASAGTFDLTINTTAVFQIQNLQLRLFALVDPQAPVGSVGTAVPANTSLLFASSETTGQDTVPTISLGAGRYLLEVTGQVTGSSGGSYAGVANLASVAAVPEPHAMWLVVPGLLALTVRRGRRG